MVDLFVHWAPDELAFSLEIHWHWLRWILVLAAACLALQLVLRHKKSDKKKFVPQLIYSAVGLLLVIRLAYCLISQGKYFLGHIVEIVWPSTTEAPFSIDVRWYSLCWVLALMSGYVVMQRLYRHQGIDDKKFEPLFMYCFIGILLGARLGHCLFYEPEYFLSHPVEIVWPFRNGVFTGFQGLASHGGTLGLMLALWLYNRRHKVGLWTILDNIAIATPIAACFIRLGNLMNSEIVGCATTLPWGFVFENNGEDFARHPGQLYEAVTYLLLFFVGLWIYWHSKHRNLETSKHRSCEAANTRGNEAAKPRVGTGWYFGWCLLSIFTARFFIEIVKDVQEAWERDMLLNMGQLLSIPFIALGTYCMYRAGKRTSSPTTT